MRRLLLPVSALLAVLLLLLYFREGADIRNAPELEPSGFEVSTANEEALLSGESPSTLPGRTTLASAAPQVVTPEGNAAVSPEVPRCRVFGRLTDESGVGLPDVGVSLVPVREPWISPKVHPERIDGFETKSGADGFFQFDTPLPTSDWIQLVVHPSPFYFSTDRHFGDGGKRGRNFLKEGDNDLGALVLKDAGVIEGRILNERGLPLKAVSLHTRNERRERMQAQADDDGNFRIERVPAGINDVEAHATGYISSVLEGVRVRKGEVTGLLEFQLEPASYIEGRIVGSGGENLQYAWIHGTPVQGGRRAAAHIEEDGQFRLYLSSDEPVTLSAEKEGYEKFFSGKTTYKPGDRNIEIVLEKLRTTSFLVRDAATGEPIESFDLKVIVARTKTNRYGHRETAVPDYFTDHEEGIQVLPASPPYDDYTIAALGYAPKRDLVEFDPPGEKRVQTILMYPAGSLTGRFIHEGKPLQNHNVSIAADRYPLVAGMTEGEGDPHSKDWGTDVDPFAGARRNFQGDGEGRFLIENIAPGTYELIFDAALAAPTKVERIVVTAGPVTDIGDVHAAVPGSIRGRIALSSGMPLSGLEVGLGRGRRGEREPDDDSLRTTDASGTFLFSDLGEGRYWLWVLLKKKVLVPGPPLEIELAQGETRDIELDLSHREPALLEVVVSSNSFSPEGWKVLIENSEDTRFHFKVGQTDARGRCTGDAPERKESVVMIQGHKGFEIGRSKPLNLRRGVRTQVELALEPGRLHVTIPMSLEDTRTERGHFGFWIRLGPADAEVLWHATRLTKEDLNEESGEPRFDLGCLAPADYRLLVRHETREFEGQATVVAGKTVTCRLSE